VLLGRSDYCSKGCGMRQDHVKHAVVSFALTLIFLIPAQWVEWWFFVAPFIAFSFGVWKEWYDRGTTGFDLTDILADAVGVSIALALFSIGMN